MFYPLPALDKATRHHPEIAQRGDQPQPVLDQLVAAVRGIDIVWHHLAENSPLIGKSLAEANIRTQTGASVIALVRDQLVVPNPKSDTRFLKGDMVGLIGSGPEVASAARLLDPSPGTVS